MDRPLTTRERGVLDALLAVDFEGVDELRRQAANVRVVSECGCGCPSIDFVIGLGLGMQVRTQASIRGSDDGLFLYTIEDETAAGDLLGGVEYLGVSGDRDPPEFPDPTLLVVEAE